MVLDIEVGLSSGDFVLDGYPAPSSNRGRILLPNFRPISIVATRGWMYQDATWYGGRPQPRGLCVRWDSPTPPQKGGGAPDF